MSKYNLNSFNTTDLVLNVMAHCARAVSKDINDDDVANTMYDICCDLEDFPEDEGFGSSDHYSYVESARREYGLTTNQDYRAAMATIARYLAEGNARPFNYNEADATHKEIDRLTAYFSKEAEAA